MIDIYTIVSKLLEIEKEISREKGSFNLFGLFFREDGINWNILVASEWIDKDKYGSIRYISSIIQHNLSAEELSYISGIEIIDSNNPYLESIYRTIHVEHDIVEIGNRVFFGFWIKYAYIITSKSTTQHLGDGRIIEEGSPGQIFDRSKN
jgi:hypothetical protein